tara:strand:+ start:431 stop:814 length:384 start_codon:yes stop_codon:yes gene_type:complete
MFIERFRSDNKTLKFTGYYVEMPEELINKPIGTEVFLQEYETGDPKNRPLDKVVQGNKPNNVAGYRTGLATWYWENGNIKQKTMHKKGIPNGLSESFYKNGQLESKGTLVKNGRRSKDWKKFKNNEE